MTSKNASHAIIDQFKLDALIGRGGMGDIWRATHTSENTQVAIKLMRSEIARSTQARELFRREAEVMQQLKNPHVVQVYQYAMTTERTPYMVMELLKGQNLRERLEQGEPITLLEALHIMTQVLKALSEAHQLGIIHRDIKPSNIFLQRSEVSSGGLTPHLHAQHDSSQSTIHAKIMDFGLATQHTHTHLKTHPSELVGTYLFMAPEQANREKITPRADIYSVGATLYTLLARRPPRVPTGADAPMSHFEQPAPDLSEVMPHLKIPRKLSQLIKRCLAIEPRERPDNADVVRRALEQISHQIIRGFSRDIDEFSLSPHAPTPQPTPSFNGISEGPQASQDLLASPLNLSGLVQKRHREIVEKWAQKIADRPGRSSIKTHHLKTYLKVTLEQLSGISLGRDSSLYHDQLLPLTQMSFSDPPLELLPIISLSLLRQIITQELTELDIDRAPIYAAFDLSVFKLRQRFIEITVSSQHYESGNGLYRLFSSGSETPILCTLSGVAINTHPKLRTALIHDENASLTGRKIFDILRGFQPIHTLYESLRRVHEYPPHTYYELKNESSTGRAEQLIIHPHLINYTQQQLLVIIDVTSERYMTEFIPALDHFEPELGSPQSLPWNQTVEVQALRPEEVTRRPPQRHEGYILNHGALGSQREPQSPIAPHPSPVSELPDDFTPHARVVPPQHSDPHPQTPPHPQPRPPQASPTYGHSVGHNEEAQTAAYGGPHGMSQSYPSHPSVKTEAKVHTSDSKIESSLKRGDWGEPRPNYQARRVVHDHTEQRRVQHSRSHLNSTISRPPAHHKSTPPPRFHPSAQPHARSVSTPVMPASPTSQRDIIRTQQAKSHLDPMRGISTSQPHHTIDAMKSASQPHPSATPFPLRSPDVEESIEPYERYLSNEPSHAPHHYDSAVSHGPHHAHISLGPLPPTPPPPLPRSTDQQISPTPPTFQSTAPEIERERGDHHRPPQVILKTPIESPPHGAASTEQVSLIEPALHSSSSSQQQLHAREPVHRRHPEALPQSENRQSWLVNGLIFTVFVLSLVILHEPLLRLLEPSPPQVSSRNRGGESSQDPLSATAFESSGIGSDSDEVYVMIKVNTNKATFLVDQTRQVVCQHVPLCVTPVTESILIYAQGYKELRLAPKDLQRHARGSWVINLEPE